jgi:hypothetical protein
MFQVSPSKIISTPKSSSFFTFLQENCKESKFLLPKKKPQDDTLKKDEAEKLMGYILDRDFYEINKTIRNKYKSQSFIY